MKIVDLHNDTISQILKSGESLYNNTCHFDIKRARQGGIGIQFFALFTMPSGMNESLRQILKQIYKLYEQLRHYPDDLKLILNPADIEIADKNNRIGCILHLEGADALGSDIEMLFLLKQLGLRSLALTWNNRNLLADGVGEEPGAGGISKKGKEVIEILDNESIILDLAHASQKTYYQALEIYSKPVIVSHANARALCNHPRNLDDSQLKALANNGGVIGINQVPDFLREDSFPNIDDILNHIAYIAELIGVEHIALGSDFDGDDILLMPGVQAYAQWHDLLTSKGFSINEINMILRENAIRIIKAVL
ncbi:MAG: dipeptidase [Syntrophomonadaceae bacterium]